MDMPTVDQKPTPRSQRGSRSSHGANQMAEEPGEQSVEPPILPIEPQTPGVQSISSFPEIATQDNAFVDDKFAKQSIIDEKLEGPNQMQAPRTDARPASPPTNRKTPKGHETGDLEHAGSPEGQITAAAKVTPLGPATTHEDSHDAAIGEKTAKYDATGDQLVTRSLEEQARLPAPTHEAKDPIGGRRVSKEPQLRGNSKTEAARAERKSTLSDQKPARFAQPLSPVEPVNIDSNDYEADDTMAPQMAFQQQARPSARIIREVPTSDRQSVTRNIQEATPYSHHTEDSERPPFLSKKDQISQASQAIPPPEFMKYSPSAKDSPKLDIQPPLAKDHKVSHDDRKLVSPRWSKEPTSQVQPPSVPSQDADPFGDPSSQQSSIKQWQRASVPLNDMTNSSRDATDMPTIDQKPTPPRGSHSGHGGNQIDKEGGEQRVEAPILPIEHDISGVQSTSPAFPATTDHAAIDGKFAKQSITAEKLGEPKQTQASIADARPASPSTNRKIPDGVETGGLEQASSSDGQISDAAKAIPPGPATIYEDSHDAVIDKKTTKHGSSGDQLITGPLQEQAHPPAPTRGAMEPIGSRRTSKEPQLHGSSQAEVVDAERKSIMSDQKPARAAQPLSPVEPVNIDNKVYGAYDTIAPQMTFRQQARPLAPITKAVPASEFQSVKRKIQEVTPNYHHIEDSGKPLVPSQEDQISHAPQESPPQEDLKYSPSSRDSPKSDIQPPLVQDHEVAHDDQKLVSPLRSKKPTYQGQPPSGPSQDAAPPEDLSNKLSTVEQWQRASVPLANQMAKESGEQRKETPILPIESEASGVQSTSPSFPEAVTTHHAIIDDKFAKQSNIDERLGERIQMRAPITDSLPTSPPIKRKAPDGPETGDLVPASSSQGQSDAAKATPPGPATIREDYHDAATDEKTTKYDASGDQLVTGSLHEQARPHAPTHEATEPIHGRQTSKEPQLRGSSQDEVAHDEQKSILSKGSSFCAASFPRYEIFTKRKGFSEIGY
ncbi:hypothetical protein PR202_gb23177 [Eleusine coracana subsp. coracana]|uniref:Uncharacterized protein n=1 Tax=Eleusine coracana subsp. coracana TaxID=191504 RepID=A0AAV5FHK5_ELECO|nr:hypothetical protein PR202_gb23177 [Eleusine coracana subsp. coracana]